MNQELRAKIIKEASPWILTSTLEIIELTNPRLYLCLGHESAHAMGYWASYDFTGNPVTLWQKLSLSTLLQIVRDEASERQFLRPKTFSYEETAYHDKQALSIWAVGNDGLLYHTIWLLSGACVMSWSAYTRSRANKAMVEWDWKNYRKCLTENGRF